MNSITLDLNNLSKFIMKARCQYLARMPENGTRVNQDAHETAFSEGEMLYQRSYMGAISLIGKEIIFLNNKPVWGMSFFGTTENRGREVAERGYL